MNLKKLLLLMVVAGTFTGTNVLASGHVKYYDDPLSKTFISNPKKLPDYALQHALRQQAVWQNFLNENGHWNVIFNESSGMPHRAFGKPVAVPGANAKSASLNFLSNQLRTFNLPASGIEFSNVATNSKYHYVSYKQFYQGLEVLFSKVQVRLTHDLRVTQFTLDCYNSINIGITPAISQTAAAQYAGNNIPGLLQVTMNPDLKILPVPGNRDYKFHLVYEATAENRDAEGMPGKYYTLVDAATGDILYRSNKIHHVANTDVNVTGSLHLTHPYDPFTVEPLKNMKVVENGVTYYTDDAGFLNLPTASATTATFSLEGRWVKVQSNNVTPSWSVSLSPGANNIDIDASPNNIRQRSTFNSINTVHEYMKSKFPAFTGLDVALEANVDVSGSCNAFYDGNSVNFFASGGGCNATSLVADVCYHEYGHGINDKFYQSIGESWDNGAMGEGYADIWALGITGAPVLGIGFFDNDPNGFVRRYDVDKKVYPQDLVGQVHADGEIIAGCFWDTGLNLGNLQQMIDLFKESYYAGITGPDGTEGILYVDVLEEVLALDDNDGDITNGTPNYCDITSAFAIHGISLSASSGITHSEVLQVAALQPITVPVVIQGLGAGSNVQGYYRIGNTGAFTQFAFTNTSGNNYEGIIAGQPNGTIVEYYLGIEDNCGTFLNVIPGGADDVANPNIPYYIMVGYTLNILEDFDAFAGAWITGLPTDDATTGNWIVDVPMESFVGTGFVQPDYQFTPGGIFCAITGNASSPQAGAGENDVDGGRTTLVSPTYDLSAINNPAISYYRWYSNDQGATPGTDFWQVSISDDGVNWVPVENTNVADHSWRRFSFRVLDYVTNSSTVTVRLVAEDANDGSLVEALVDDFTIWENGFVGLPQTEVLSAITIYPNPVNNELNVSLGLAADETIAFEIIDAVGRVIQSETVAMTAGKNSYRFSTEALASGLYQLRASAGDQNMIRKFSVVK